MTLPELWQESWTAAVVNHLWQSTLAVGIAWLLALALRRNHARARYWVWMAASVKFLVPFSLFVAAGEWMRSLIPAPTARPAIAAAMEQMAQPFPQTDFLSATETPMAAHHANLLPVFLLAIWACGALMVMARFARAWWRVNAAKRAAIPIGTVRGNQIVEPNDPSAASQAAKKPSAWVFVTRARLQSGRKGPTQSTWASAPALPINACIPKLPNFSEVPVLSSPEPIEPGIFGIFRPVLMLPEGILERLTAEQLRAILAHEMCHVRRRDNLTFAIHMLVETLFWFHPAAWWIGARLIDERERACDEAVVQAGSAAEVYAESILSVCKFYVESPLACVAGITGADLKKRIECIMTRQCQSRLSWQAKLMVGAAALTVLIAPMTIGLAQPAKVMPDWQKAAGGKMEFEVASVKENRGDGQRPSENFPLGPGDVYEPVGGLFRATNLQLMTYIGFAYKITGNHGAELEKQLPEWARTDRFNIEAHANGTPTKDQMRLMMQALLKDRFGLAIHYEMRESAVYALELAKPEKLGPQLRPHPANMACANQSPVDKISGTNPIKALPADADGYPTTCGGVVKIPPTMQGTQTAGASNVKIQRLADFIADVGQMGRPVVDRTGLTGMYDFKLEWTPDNLSAATPSETNAAVDSSGPLLIEALKEQLGLKLKPDKAQVEEIIVDHIDHLSAN